MMMSWCRMAGNGGRKVKEGGTCNGRNGPFLKSEKEKGGGVRPLGLFGWLWLGETAAVGS